MSTYDLTVSAPGSPPTTLPTSATPYGAYNAGDAFDWNGRRWSIGTVAHTVVPGPSGPFVRTALFLVASPHGNFAGNTSLADVAPAGGWITSG